MEAIASPLKISGQIEVTQNLPPVQDYISGAIRTESPASAEVNARMARSVRGLHAAMGVATEAGELVDAFKKHIFYGKPLDKVNVVEEVGDLFWYLAILADDLGFTFEECMQANLKKLRLRYPEKYDDRLALERDLASERASLEQSWISVPATSFIR